MKRDLGRLFAALRPRHISQACRRAIQEGVPTRRLARSTFVPFRGHRLPAKYILGLAYRLATGRKLSPDDYHGGEATARVLRRLGVSVIHQWQKSRHFAERALPATKKSSDEAARTASKDQRTSSVAGHTRPNIRALRADPARGREVGRILYKAFMTPGVGIFGKTEMPEDAPPRGVTRGSLEHILVITLTVAIDYQRDAHELWRVARETHEDPATRFVFDPTLVVRKSRASLMSALRRHGLSRKHHRDAAFWHTVASTLLTKWQGNPRRFIEACSYDASIILDRLARDCHDEDGKARLDFPSLRGRKIAPLWVRMLTTSACPSGI